EPLPIAQWEALGARVRIALAPESDSDVSYDLRVVGTGLAVWAAFAIDEAIAELTREQARRREAAEREVLRQLGAAEDTRIRLGERTRLYVFDEPERHLHPKAQQQAARWLAERAGRDTAVVMATHSLSFLTLPSEDAEYVFV